MYISKIKLINYKGFYGETEFDFGPNLTFISGQNNVGKSTVFSAITVLRDGKEENLIQNKNKQADVEENVTIAIELTDPNLETYIESLVTKNKQEVLKSYVYQDENGQHLTLQRSTEIFEFKKTDGKTSTTKSGDLTILNVSENNYENPTGIDGPIKSLFDIVWIQADQSADSEVNFKTSGTIGKIISSLSVSFTQTPEFIKLEQAHKKAFDKLDQTLVPQLNSQIDNILSDQYGAGISTKIDFILPEIKNLLSNANLLVDDGIETNIDEKGNGLQRSIALALIQFQSTLKNESVEDDEIFQPIFYLIDEPEVYLHPKGQHKLRDSLVTLSGSTQILISTHSPFVLDNYSKNDQKIILLNKVLKDKIGKIEISDISSKLGIFGGVPTTAEITYYAYEIPTFEFHNQLFDKVIDLRNIYSVKKTDQFIHNNLPSDADPSLLYHTEFQRNDGQTTYYDTLPTAIRNKCHHSSTDLYSCFTNEQLQLSIECLINIIQNIQNSSIAV
ncbi:ATP-dependent nuclease [Leuconostoc mesenteroides]|uniref:ATP-dependent nuclease n=1 Tax=Leuconostoc mesenteroides TaxID=1245 RepID=UPI00235F32BE|nr:AAA family ATPase [Leuconostoc mesenteroides]